MNAKKNDLRQGAEVSGHGAAGAHTVDFGVSEKSAAIFHAAQRHSGRVRVLKTALPIAAVAIAGVFSWFTFLSTPAAPIKVQVGTTGMEDGKLVMTDPKLDGFTKENLPYTMTAARATQDVTNSGVITLENIDAELPLGDNDRAKITAKSGIYDNANERLQLDKDFTVTTSNGLTAKLKSADVNISTGQITTDQPVDIQSGNAHILADKMQLQDNGQVMVFEDKVKLVIAPAKEQKDDISVPGNDG
ncbi:LPS export ABC transporter periplasmic protein LptC [Phyllobacterium phragmitis]|uniref:LPS export ABC transporter periplasmic protein LptC n=1 Tax=Phyllobacterium phragmitis TaxID=2670329 RepID=A0A2S9IS56_9HYPH|nr:LPS export ABC transporter periplasmic protein LptC [Phyllobacterium phragmitis]PRD43363.1 LPS export ABC transporter periplasmic protein LptC [Phyllobacterium phragmitis]